MGCLMSEIVDQERPLSEKQVLEQIKEENSTLWDEIAEFMNLLEEWGITSYKLSGSLEDPIITSYQIT